MSYDAQHHQDERIYEYERYIGDYFYQIMDCSVIYYRDAIKLPEGIIDVIAISPDKTYLIHCKPSPSTRLSGYCAFIADEINQLCGEAKVFANKFPNAKNIVPVIIAPEVSLSADAIVAARVHDVMKLTLKYTKQQTETENILRGNNFTTTLPLVHEDDTVSQGAFDAFVSREIEQVQYHKPFRFKDCVRNVALGIWFCLFEIILTAVLLVFDMHPYALISVTLASLALFLGLFFSKSFIFDKEHRAPKLYCAAINAIGCYTLIPIGAILALYNIDAALFVVTLPVIGILPWVVPCMFVSPVYHALYELIVKKLS